MCCSFQCGLKCGAWFLVAGALLYLGVQSWLNNKSYVFDAEDVADITRQALKSTESTDHEVIFGIVEKELRKRYGDHILNPMHKEWIFVNAGGWMGAMCVLHASVTEYLLFFGTAINTSGHSGRYWANITDTLISGQYVQWKEGTTRTILYNVGDTVYHRVGETTAMEWKAPFWAVEYGRGFIPSTLGFAFSDSFFSTQDMYIVYRTIRIYLIALFHEVLQFNF